MDCKMGDVELCRTILARAQKDYKRLMKDAKSVKTAKQKKAFKDSMDDMTEFMKSKEFDLYCAIAGYDEQRARRMIIENSMPF